MDCVLIKGGVYVFKRVVLRRSSSIFIHKLFQAKSNGTDLLRIKDCLVQGGWNYPDKAERKTCPDNSNTVRIIPTLSG